MRLFTGIKIDRHIKDLITDYQNKYADTKALRLTIPENLHITLCFLGEQNEQKLPLINNILLEIANVSDSFDLTFEKFCFIPSKNYPAMLWAKFKLTEHFFKLSENIHKRLKIPFNERKIHPHITLGRFKPPTKSTFQEYKHTNAALRVEEFALWKSILHQTGPEYIELKEFSLRNSI